MSEAGSRRVAGAEGENTIADSSGNEVAHQDDFRWDPTERVYRLPVEGGEELHYQRFGDEWQRVVTVGDEWQPAG